MTSLPSEPSPSGRLRPASRRRSQRRPGAFPLTLLILLGLGGLLLRSLPSASIRQLQQTVWVSHPEPLVMDGGDPYIRALMRTISAAESNTNEPYHVLYGGQAVDQLNRHPDVCVEIVAGPNTGNCTTAAGRYQFLTNTWEEKAEKYHPAPPSWFGVWVEYSFDPKSQDLVVYNWLKDTAAWNLDIAATLRQGQLDTVLRRLSGTWTSLGYGIEPNSMTAKLPRIYQKILEEELEQAQSTSLR